MTADFDKSRTEFMPVRAGQFSLHHTHLIHNSRPNLSADRRIGLVGFCFGGLAALQLARSGAPIAAAVSIHGSLATSAPARAGAVTARILACHGAADPHVPPADVAAFAEEMNHAGAIEMLPRLRTASSAYQRKNSAE